MLLPCVWHRSSSGGALSAFAACVESANATKKLQASLVRLRTADSSISPRLRWQMKGDLDPAAVLAIAHLSTLLLAPTGDLKDDHEHLCP